jgi:hypothetical protein
VVSGTGLGPAHEMTQGFRDVQSNSCIIGIDAVQV